MNKIEIAVCDTEDKYRRRFVSYLVKHKPEEFAVHAFSSCEILEKNLQENSFDAVLLGQGFERIDTSALRKKIPLLVLREDVLEAETELCLEKTVNEIYMFRYQPMEKVIHNIYVLTGGRHRQMAMGGAAMRRLEIIGVCSPICHEMQMPFSIVMSSVLSEQKKLLYVNLMEYAGFLELFGLEEYSDLGDIILKLRGKRLCEENFQQSVHEFYTFFYIMPFLSPQSLHEVTGEDMKNFLLFLEEHTDFEMVVIDIGNGVSEFFKLLEVCSSSYCLTKQGFFFECRMHEFLACLDTKNDRYIRENLHVLELPFLAKYLKRGSSVFQQLIWSEFGDYVRSYLSGMENKNAGDSHGRTYESHYGTD